MAARKKRPRYSLRSRGGYQGPGASEVKITRTDGAMESQPARPDPYRRWGEQAQRELQRKLNRGKRQ